jgi:ankyrin repeat protein
MEKLDKDRLFLIAMELDLPGLLNFCQTNKTINERICNNKYIWLAKLRKDFDFVFDDYINFEDPKMAYKLIYSNKKLMFDIRDEGQRIYQASKMGSKKLFLYILKKSQENFPSHYSLTTNKMMYESLLRYGMSGAIESGNLNLVKYFVEDMNEKIEYYNFKEAIGNLKILNYLYSRNKSIKLNSLLSKAVENGDKNIVDFLIENGADNWNEGLEGAVKGNNIEMFNYFVSKGATHMNYLFEIAVKNKNKEIIKRIFDHNIKPLFLNNGYKIALQSGDKDLIDFLTNLISQKHKIKNFRIF